MTRRSAVPVAEIRHALDRVNGDSAPISPLLPTDGELGKMGKMGRLVKLAKQARRVSDVEGEELDWIQAGYVPVGKISTSEGPPGIGKTTVEIDRIARLTTGRPMPFDDAPPRAPRSALILSNEDGLADTIKWRLNAAGADQNLVIEVPPEMDGEDVDLGNIPALTALFQEYRPIELLVDGLDGYWPKNMKGHQASDIRRALGPVARLAQEYGVAVRLIRHINKRLEGISAMHAGLGGVSIIGTARAGSLSLPDPRDKTLITMASIKHNLSAAPPSLEYRIVPVTVTNPKTGGDVQTTRIEWLRTSPLTGDDLVGRVQREVMDRAANSNAKDWLNDHLSPGVGKPKDEVLAAGVAAGFSKSQIEYAAGKVAISHKPFGGRATWTLAQSPQFPQPPQSPHVESVGRLEPTPANEAPGTSDDPELDEINLALEETP